MRTAVVLPAPFGPSTPRIAPAGTRRSSPSRATVDPNRFASPWASITASVVPPSPYRPASEESEERRCLLAGRQVNFAVMPGRSAPDAPASGARPAGEESPVRRGGGVTGGGHLRVAPRPVNQE